MEPDTTETLTVETQKETPRTVNESTNTHMHRRVQHKRAVALCAGDPRTVHFAEEQQQHEQKTTRSRLATTGKVKDQGSLLGTVYTHTGHSPWRSSAYRQSETIKGAPPTGDDCIHIGFRLQERRKT